MNHIWIQLRRCFRFSLRTFLIIVTLLAAWMALYVRGVQQQKAAVAAITEAGGSVRYDYEFPSTEYHWRNFEPKSKSPVPEWLLKLVGVDFFHNVVEVDLFLIRRPGTPENKWDANHGNELMKHVVDLPELRALNWTGRELPAQQLKHAKNLERIFFSELEFGDAEVLHLANLKKLKCVTLWTDGMTDESTKVLAKLPRLRELDLNGRSLTADSLKIIGGLHEITELSLIGISASDDDLTHLAELRQLKTLCLYQSRITDAGLKHFEQLPSLRVLLIGDTGITWRGADQWKKAKRPDIKFEGGGLR